VKISLQTSVRHCTPSCLWHINSTRPGEGQESYNIINIYCCYARNAIEEVSALVNTVHFMAYGYYRQYIDERYIEALR
jgi:hypothetical protein